MGACIQWRTRTVLHTEHRCSPVRRGIRATIGGRRCVALVVSIRGAVAGAVLRPVAEAIIVTVTVTAAVETSIVIITWMCVCVRLVLVAQCCRAYCIYASGCQRQESTERSSLSARRRLVCYRSRQHSHNLPVAVGTRGARGSIPFAAVRTAPVFVQSLKK